ncbi:probable inactive peptidyl-prolyl cis-trans isomerase-like 6 [Diabrotica virgifera virgifera]|uniref:PPIase cyclophilin-type domain-containing protein n=2 Tax=Diabrotica virgifera virgifera TaxID=50390 RepID=A0ABM5JI22_DIAVI|nr:probable inactive peptidyl-prolyl cis-trans isomerase-like 6 [Diabrotica virgifera virgifera]
MDYSEEKTQSAKEKFEISGIITSAAFQRCRFLAIKLYRSFPKQYEHPVIKPMLNVEWEQFLTKMQRTFGNGIWALKKPVIVFEKEQFIGDDKAFVNHLIKKYHFSLNLDLDQIGKCHLVEFLREKMTKYRQIAYFTIAINNQVVGTMMFELYNDLVPLACENFLKRCKDINGGYTGTPVHRIVKNSWIQCGRWNLTERKMPCENYVIPHDRRGVLCTTNTGRHKENSTQFFITLAPTPWMDYNYVAFGQLLQGEEVLKAIEKVPTYYESPTLPITIVMSGEVTLDGIPDYFTSMERPEFQSILPSLSKDNLYAVDDCNLIPTTSRFSMSKYKKGLYGLETDMTINMEYPNLPDYLMPRLMGESEASYPSTLSIQQWSPLDQDQIQTPPDFYKILKDCNMPGVSDTTL